MAFDYEITVYDGAEILFTKTIKSGSIGGQKRNELMRCLTAKYAQLSGDEIVNSFLNKNAKSHHDLLLIQNDASPEKFILSCGDSVHTVVTGRPSE